MTNKINATAAFLGLTAIVLGAFGAHALKNYLSVAQLATFETGVKYQRYHFYTFYSKKALSVLNFICIRSEEHTSELQSRP